MSNQTNKPLETKPEEEYPLVTLNLSLPSDLRDYLQMKAKAEGVSMSFIARLLIEAIRDGKIMLRPMLLINNNPELTAV